MRTVSTRIENKDHEQFMDFCNKEGQTISETLRDLVKDYCRACKEDEEFEDESETQIKVEPVSEFRIKSVK